MNQAAEGKVYAYIYKRNTRIPNPENKISIFDQGHKTKRPCEREIKKEQL